VNSRSRQQARTDKTAMVSCGYPYPLMIATTLLAIANVFFVAALATKYWGTFSLSAAADYHLGLFQICSSKPDCVTIKSDCSSPPLFPQDFAECSHFNGARALAIITIIFSLLQQLLSVGFPLDKSLLQKLSWVAGLIASGITIGAMAEYNSDWRPHVKFGVATVTSGYSFVLWVIGSLFLFVALGAFVWVFCTPRPTDTDPEPTAASSGYVREVDDFASGD
jgi:dipeptide/tripeptide permease